MPTFISRSVVETERFGQQLGQDACEGTIFALEGDLGAGKTALIRGLVRGVGAESRVHSPTYSLINLYPSGRVPVAHLDLYRLQSPEEIVAAGLEEYLGGREGIVAVEWASRWEFPSIMANRVRRIRLRMVDENVREIDYDDPRS
ncbi:MAG TPA: tRNA (adenosine(37)-N6)-threonylcarbamoyltransferase complex ATPase subunit type 1 TsaE [Candidatus Limnocylindria bacterium]|jgi:tRNA threonylcarbamoyladenosine biosynthesis protein TsaE|nr:tRNA (adenosine(37)-N6)-threonylcarbamoyltransferase complex ATPase subunit type 1 TsaE [Candidatus Limnocylindria bacterium]